MHTQGRSALVRAIRVLEDSVPANEALRRLVRTLDVAAADDAAPPASSFATALIVRALVRLGAALPDIDSDAMSNVRHTLACGEAHLRTPSEATYDAYELASTSSYPFGQGDGCYRLPGEASCDVGTGCRSGAGSIYQVALAVGEERALFLLRAALADVLRAESEDP